MQKRILFSVCLLLTGCDLSDSDLCASYDDLEGEWNIVGNVTMFDCETPDMNSDFTFVSEPLMMVEKQNLDGNWIIVHAEPNDGFTLFGLVGSSEYSEAISFKTREDTPEGEISLFFEGNKVCGGGAEGQITGIAPGGCKLSGRFTLSYEYTPYSPSQPWDDDWLPTTEGERGGEVDASLSGADNPGADEGDTEASSDGEDGDTPDSETSPETEASDEESDEDGEEESDEESDVESDEASDEETSSGS